MPSSLLVIGAGILLVAITVLTYRRIHLSKDLDELTAKIRQAFAEPSKSAQTENSTTSLDKNLAMCFEGQVLTVALQEAFTNRFAALYRDACKLAKRAQQGHVSLPDAIRRFIRDFEAIPDIIRNHNEKIIRSRTLIGNGKSRNVANS